MIALLADSRTVASQTTNHRIPTSLTSPTRDIVPHLTPYTDSRTIADNTSLHNTTRQAPTSRGKGNRNLLNIVALITFIAVCTVDT